jgi:hypothetical protein
MKRRLDKIRRESVPEVEPKLEEVSFVKAEDKIDHVANHR